MPWCKKLDAQGLSFWPPSNPARWGCWTGNGSSFWLQRTSEELVALGL